MVSFQDWASSIQFALVYAIIIVIPCTLVGWFGKHLIDELGRHPSKSAIIHMKAFLPLVVIQIITFSLLIGFYKFFFGVKGS